LSIKGISSHVKYKINHKTNNNGIIERRCTKCGEWKEEILINFYLKNKSKPEIGFTPMCRVCTGLKQIIYAREHKEEQSANFKAWHLRNKKYINNWCVEWRQTHHEEKREYEKEYYLKYPEKFKQYNENHRDHDITKKEWKHCLEVFDYRCAYCGISEEDHLKLYNQVLHKDHADCMGANDLSNGIPACRSCNSKKHDNDIEIWFKEQKFYEEEKLEFIMWWLIEGYKNYIEEKPPYKVVMKQNEHNKKFHWELWSMDEMRNMVECLISKDKKKDIVYCIPEYFN